MAPQPQFFIIRSRPIIHGPTDSRDAVPYERIIVPVIPVDLLPEWVSIQGVPRQLSLEDTTGMTNLGSFGAADEVLALRFAELYTGQQGRAIEEPGSLLDDFDEYGRNLDTAVDGRVHGEKNAPGRAAKRKSDEQRQQTSSWAMHRQLGNHTPTPAPSHSSNDNSTISNAAAPRARRVRPVSSPPDASHPKYCQAWCHHGVCPRGNKCRQRHTMPQTIQGLTEIGLQALPAWYRSRTRGRGHSSQDELHDTKMSQRSEFSAASTSRRHLADDDGAGLAAEIAALGIGEDRMASEGRAAGHRAGRGVSSDREQPLVDV